MTCTSFQRIVGDVVAGELSAAAVAEAHAHRESCVSCARLYRESVGTVALLRRLGEEPPDPAFAAALHRRLVAEGKPAKHGALRRRLDALLDFSSSRWVPALGLGALLLAGGAGVYSLTRHGHTVPAEAVATGPVTPVFRVPQTKLAVVRIDFVAEQAVEDVEFTVVLPDGLRFVSDGQVLSEREVRWRGRLERGSNQIPIAVRGERAGRFAIAARATTTDLAAEHHVMLEVIKG
jgi:hypothetical protein